MVLGRVPAPGELAVGDSAVGEVAEECHYVIYPSMHVIPCTRGIRNYPYDNEKSCDPADYFSNQGIFPLLVSGHGERYGSGCATPGRARAASAQGRPSAVYY